MTNEEGQTIDLFPLNGFDDYEILNDYPFTIRKKSNHENLKIWFKNKGYPCVSINSSTHSIHRLVAKQ